MSDPINSGGGVGDIRAMFPPTTQTTQPASVEGKDFKEYMLESLNKVNQLQSEADAGVQRLLTGEADNVAEVLIASKKAGVAFDLLMEIRNKLIDAYSEIRQMRV